MRTGRRVLAHSSPSGNSGAGIGVCVAIRPPITPHPVSHAPPRACRTPPVRGEPVLSLPKGRAAVRDGPCRTTKPRHPTVRGEPVLSLSKWPGRSLSEARVEPHVSATKPSSLPSHFSLFSAHSWLPPLPGERQNLPRTRSGVPASSPEIGEGASGLGTQATAQIALSSRIGERNRAGPRDPIVHAAPPICLGYGLRPPVHAPCGATTWQSEPSPQPDPPAQTTPCASSGLLPLLPAMPGPDPRPTLYLHRRPIPPPVSQLHNHPPPSSRRPRPILSRAGV